VALPNLAAAADLSARGVDDPDGVLADVMLGVASALVREAAGSPILETTATVTFWALEGGQWLTVPVRPVRSVSAVTVDGTALASSEYKLVYGDLWRDCGWVDANPYWDEPVEVEVTCVAGLPEVPESIVQLVCDLAILGMNTATTGAVDPRLVAERIDDYSVTFSQGAAAVASAMSIPNATRLSLRTRFGGGVGSLRLR
jgi:hypothetical protein